MGRPVASSQISYSTAVRALYVSELCFALRLAVSVPVQAARHAAEWELSRWRTSGWVLSRTDGSAHECYGTRSVAAMERGRSAAEPRLRPQKRGRHEMVGKRKDIPAATEAALWALSNGRCYAPACPLPVIFEVRPGVYRKNAQIAHIYGVRPGTPRFEEEMPDEERDAFSNLLLLCQPHHSDVDDKKTGQRLYPRELLRQWKVDHEGSNGHALAKLGTIDEERLTELLEDVFTPPAERLQAIAEQLEQTGTLNRKSVAELRQIVAVLTDAPTGPDARIATLLGFAAEFFGSSSFDKVAKSFAAAAEKLPSDKEITRLVGAADTILAASKNIHL